MALPISPTPVLRGRDAKRFDEKIIVDLKTKMPLIATPKLEEARKLAIEYANKGKK